MRGRLQTVLSRRTLVKAGAVLSTAFLAACDRFIEDDSTPDGEPTASAAPIDQGRPDPTATPQPEPTATPEPTPTPTPEPPEPVSYWVAPEFNSDHHRLVRLAIERIEETALHLGAESVRVDNPDRATIQIIRSGTEANGEHVATLTGDALIPVVRTDLIVDRISAEDLMSMFTGGIQNWIELGGPDWIVHPTVSRSVDPPDFAAGSDIHSHDDLVAHAAEHPGMIALIPRAAASFHIQTLIISDVDPLRDELTAENWAWWEQIDVTFSDGDTERRDAIAELLGEVSQELIADRRTMMTVVGDVMLGRTPHRIMHARNDWIAPFPLVVDELHKGDLTIGNLECAITDSFTQPEDPTTFSLMTYTNAVEGLQFAGFDALSGANNHALDFGVVGMRDTTSALEAAGIQHFGTGDNLDEARRPCLLEADGITFALLGYDSISMAYAGATAESGGVAPLVREYFVEDIQRAREIADVVIPFFHWGIEYTLTPTDNDRRMAYAAIDAGADLVLGGHPHWVQGMEIYAGKPIFYSLSNFVFDQEWSFETKQGLVLHLIFDVTRLVGYRVVPVLIEEFYRPRIVEDDVRSTILGRFWASSSLIASAPIA